MNDLILRAVLAGDEDSLRATTVERHAALAAQYAAREAEAATRFPGVHPDLAFMMLSAEEAK